MRNSSRSSHMLHNVYLLAKTDFDTAENELSKISQNCNLCKKYFFGIFGKKVRLQTSQVRQRAVAEGHGAGRERRKRARSVELKRFSGQRIRPIAESDRRPSGAAS